MVSGFNVYILVAALTVLKLGHVQGKFGDVEIHSQLQRPNMPGSPKYMLSSSLEHPHCKVECNGEEYKPLGGGTDVLSEKEFSCWGKSYISCHFPVTDWKSTYKCNGVFRYKPLETSSNTQIKALHCEGAAIAISEFEGEIVPDSGLKCPGTCVCGTFCAVNSEFVTVRTGGTNETDIRCEGLHVSGSAVKLHSSASSQLVESTSRSLQATSDAGSDLPFTSLSRKSLSPNTATPSATEVLEAQLLAASRSSVVSPDPSTAPIPTPKRFDGSSVSNPASTTPQAENGCKLTCNGRSVSWFFEWWPCWGKAQLTCTDDFGEIRQKTIYECDGFAVPGLERCHGLLTSHTLWRTRYVDLEEMSVHGGRFHTSTFHEHGYKGGMMISTGLSTVHQKVS